MIALLALLLSASPGSGWACAKTMRNAFVQANVFALHCPEAYQVVQRSGTTGTITIKGTLPAGTHSVEARWQGGSWATIASDVSEGYTGQIAGAAQGVGAVEVRIVGETQIISASPVGVGEVFVVAGQSNASGFATNHQKYTASTIAGAFANNYEWRWLADPSDDPTGQLDSISQDTVGGSGAKGSVWVELAELLTASLGVPVAIVPCAMGGTGSNVWLPGGDTEDRTTLFGSCNYRTSITGARAWLWWQGENDAITQVSEATYNSRLDTIANTLNTDRGVPLMACKLQNSSLIADVDEAVINSAIGIAWSDNANVLQGPDFSDLGSDDGYHFTTNASIATAAARWKTALDAAFGW